MRQWQMRVENDSTYWRSRGIQINAVGGNPITGVIEIMVAADKVSQATQEIPARYPDLKITIRAGSIGF
jgi:hypothetical protein